MRYIDLHCDTIAALMQGMGTSLEKNDLCINFDKLKKAGTLAQFFACFIYAPMHEPDPEAKKENRITSAGWDRAYEYACSMSDRIDEESKAGLKVLRYYRELQDVGRDDIFAVKTVEEGGILNGNLDRLDDLYEKGVRLVTLTWNFPNCIGFPNSDDFENMSKGLTPFGIQVVEKMNDLHMMIDVSHLSDGGFWDCIRTSKTPICASHSNARGLCDHRRNLSDDMLHALGEQGGISGLNFFHDFLKKGKLATVEDLAKHAAYMITKGGEDLPAIGTDFDGFENIKRDYWINDAGDMDLLFDAFRKEGITERQIDKICTKNVLRFLDCL